MVGVILLANVNGVLLDDARFEPLWAAINERRVPVLLHPTIPPGAPAMGLDDYGLAAAVGFMFDSTLAVTRMVFSGIFERYRDWPLIVCHAGGTLPFLASRLDRCHATIPDARSRIQRRPSEYLSRLYYDTACYDSKSLALACELAGTQRVLYGTDYPHNVSDVEGAAARIDSLSVGEPERELIRSGNARRIFRLDG
jgi:aminocarboxymuconate-semialdehyde decarboxylase